MPEVWLVLSRKFRGGGEVPHVWLRAFTRRGCEVQVVSDAQAGAEVRAEMKKPSASMSRLVFTGFVISLAGAILDFASGYYASGPMSSEAGSMAAPSPTSVALYLLGILVLLGGVLLVLPGTAGRMQRLGLLMEGLGVVMALVSYLVPGMNLGLSYAMLFVGAAMILNGALMQRRKQTMGHT